MNKALLFFFILHSILCNTSSMNVSQQSIADKKQKLSIEEHIDYHKKMLHHYEELKKQKNRNDNPLWQQATRTLSRAEQAVENTLHDYCLEPCCDYFCSSYVDIFINWCFKRQKQNNT